MTATSALLVFYDPMVLPDFSQGVDNISGSGKFDGVICRPRLGRNVDTKKIDSNLVEILAIDLSGDTGLTFCINKSDVRYWIWSNTESEDDLAAVAAAFNFAAPAPDVRDYDIGHSEGSEDLPVIGILGQSYPAATTETDIYEVPALKTAAINTLICCNSTGADIQVAVSVSVSGAATTDKDYIYRNTPIPANKVIVLEIKNGFRLSSGDVVRVYADSVGVSFNLNGEEFS